MPSSCQSSFFSDFAYAAAADDGFCSFLSPRKYRRVFFQKVKVWSTAAAFNITLSYTELTRTMFLQKSRGCSRIGPPKSIGNNWEIVVDFFFPLGTYLKKGTTILSVVLFYIYIVLKNGFFTPSLKIQFPPHPPRVLLFFRLFCQTHFEDQIIQISNKTVMGVVSVKLLKRYSCEMTFSGTLREVILTARRVVKLIQRG